MAVEIPLKFKYRCHKPRGRYSGGKEGQGKPIKGTPPVGLRKRPKGKTRFA